MNFPFANWYQPIASNGGSSYQFQDYDHLSSFSTCKTTVKNQISSVQSSIGSDNTLILRFIVDRLLTVSNISSTNSFGGTTSQNYYVNYTYVEGKNPNPGNGGYSIYSFEVKKSSNNSLVSNGLLTFLSDDAAVESYVDMTVSITQIV